MIEWGTRETLWISALAIISVLVLLGASIFMILNFMICDHHTCKAFKDIDESIDPNSDEYANALLRNAAGDGIWGLAWIGATIVSLLIVWLIKETVSIRDYILTLLLVFITCYVLLNFMIHHWIKPINNYVLNHYQRLDEISLSE